MGKHRPKYHQFKQAAPGDVLVRRTMPYHPFVKISDGDKGDAFNSLTVVCDKQTGVWKDPSDPKTSGLKIRPTTLVDKIGSAPNIVHAAANAGRL